MAKRESAIPMAITLAARLTVGAATQVVIAPAARASTTAPGCQQVR